MKKILFVTGNKNKLREAREILGSGFKVEGRDLNLDEIQAIDGRTVVRYKVEQAYKKLKRPLMVEDNQLYFEAWNGLPGALIHWFLEAVGCEGICRMMENEKDRRARAVVVIGYHDGEQVRLFEGEVKGMIAKEPRGEYAFGWDPIFIPEGFDKTFAEMGMEEKNQVSMRRRALERLRDKLGV